jgi:hypothetical protein
MKANRICKKKKKRKMRKQKKVDKFKDHNER